MHKIRKSIRLGCLLAAVPVLCVGGTQAAAKADPATQPIYEKGYRDALTCNVALGIAYVELKRAGNKERAEVVKTTMVDAVSVAFTTGKRLGYSFDRIQNDVQRSPTTETSKLTQKGQFNRAVAICESANLWP